MFIFCVLLGAFIIAADQVVKYIASATLTHGQPIEIIKGVVELCYVENRGAAMGMFENSRVFLIILTIAIIAFLIAYLIHEKHIGKLTAVSSAMIIGGGAANLIDRIFTGYVVDYINLTFIDFYCFNIADIFICVGAALFALAVLLPKKNGEKNE